MLVNATDSTYPKSAPVVVMLSVAGLSFLSSFLFAERNVVSVIIIVTSYLYRPF